MKFDNKNISKAQLLTAFSALKTKVEFLQTEQTQFQKKYDLLEGKYIYAQHQIAEFKRLIFGAKSERFISEINSSQMQLFNLEPLAELIIKEQDIAYTRKIITVKKNANHHGRGYLPPELRREVITIEPEESTEGMIFISNEVKEVLECTPAEFFVKQYLRPKYAKPDGQGVLIGPLPSFPIDKCIAGVYLLATILIDKYVFHLPEYRQIQKFKLAYVKIAKSTMNGWTNACCELLTPLYEVLIKKVISSNYLMVDETYHQVLDKTKKGCSHRGFLWVYRAPLENLVLFEYKPDRTRAGPAEMLKNFQGHLQTDGYSVYEEFDKQPGITQMHCMAHARRYFEKSLTTNRALAQYMMQQFQLLYDVERFARDNNYNHQQCYELRQEKSLPLLATIHQWLKDHIDHVLPESPIGKAISYSLKRWDKLCIYTQYGHLEIDNNKVENTIRPVALGRKNFLFAGSHPAAQRAAIIRSFTEICRMKGINPYIWLSETLDKIRDCKISQLEDLLP